MPTILNGEPGTSRIDPRIHHDYAYPDGLDLSPNSDLHKDIVKKIIQRANASAGYMRRRHTQWKEIDRVLTSFMPLSEKEKQSKAADKRKPVSIVFPYSHAILESVLSYMVAAFISDPIFSYKGHGPEDVVGSILMTKVVDLDCNRTKVPLALHTMFRDAFSYGLGIVVPSWKVKTAIVYRPEQVGFFSKFRNQFTQTGVRKVESEETVFEGNELINIDPYKALLDPNTPINKFQESEFFGWLENTNKMALLEDEKTDSELFNARYLNNMEGNVSSSVFSRDESGREDRYEGSVEDNSNTVNPVDILHMYVNIIPKEWKIGTSEYPEKWYFKIAGDSLLLQAKPIGLGHGMYPAAVCAPDYDGYSTAPISRLEMLSGLQGTLDWLFNVHIANVRRAVNNMFIYDPFLVNSKDLQNPKDGWLIRTRRPSWGKGVKDVLQQLAVSDITKQNVADSSWVVQWMDKIGASDGSMMGSLRQGGPERLTGTEFQGTRQGSFSRLERMAKIIGWQAMQDIGFFFASHTQQLMSGNKYASVLGEWETLLRSEYGSAIKRGRMKIRPTDLLVFYDVLVRDGSIPGNNYSQVWEKMFQVIAADPELRNQFDIAKIFKYIARNNGATNTEEFLKVGVMPDEQVLNQVQKGNLIPFNEVRA